MGELLLRQLTSQGRPIRIGEEPVSLGRHPANTIRLDGDQASRHHCVIEKKEDSQVLLRDLGSRNGTKVNGQKVKSWSLEPGDVVKIGEHEFQLESVEDDPGEAAAVPGKRGMPSWVKELKKLVESVGRTPEDEPKRLIDADGKRTGALSGQGEGPRAIRLLFEIASLTRATDVHMEPKGEFMNVRMRVDGQMVWIVELPNRVGELVAGMIKATCLMKQAKRDSVQEGHFSVRYPDRRVEYRVSFTPSVRGQKLVIRVLDERGMPRSISELGMASYMEARIREVAKQDHGMILVCGPTGSGKTTTLYNALREIDRESRNVITIEDPVEYQLDNVTQIPVDERGGHTFEALLKSVLRQDPDVILLGEIRDEATARTAMQAAMTGHLVFTTVHANDTVAAIFRLLDLKVEPYLVANSLNLVLAQRLVRTLCDRCKSAVPVKPADATRMGRHLAGATVSYVPVGCSQCLKTGFKGRRALFELLDVNDDLRDVILREPSITAIHKIVSQGLFTTLAQFGWRLTGQGIVPLEEVDRVAGKG